MSKQNYKLSFLPLFDEDLRVITNYITNTLQNPSAAHRLVDDIELAIIKRLKCLSVMHPINRQNSERIRTTGLMFETFLFFMSSLTTLWKFVDFCIQNEILTNY